MYTDHPQLSPKINILKKFQEIAGIEWHPCPDCISSTVSAIAGGGLVIWRVKHKI